LFNAYAIGVGAHADGVAVKHLVHDRVGLADQCDVARMVPSLNTLPYVPKRHRLKRTDES
jgi:hypothetical protein